MQFLGGSGRSLVTSVRHCALSLLSCKQMLSLCETMFRLPSTLTDISVCAPQPSRWLALETGAIKPQGLAGHKTSVRAIAIGPDGRVYSGASDDTTRVWSCEDGVHLQTLEGHTLPVRSLAVTNDGKIYSGSADKTIRTRSPHKCSLHKLFDHLKSIAALCAVSFSGSDNTFLS